MRTLAYIFKALSDETRLQMLGLLFKAGELCVCDFVEVLGITQSKASRHLRYLVNAGLVLDRREAVWVYFRITDNPDSESGAVLKVLSDITTKNLSTELIENLKKWIERKNKNNSCEP